MLGSGLAEPVNVEAVDGVEVTIVVDNFIDVLMAGAEGVHRYLAYDFADRDPAAVTSKPKASRSSRSGGRRYCSTEGSWSRDKSNGRPSSRRASRFTTRGRTPAGSPIR